MTTGGKHPGLNMKQPGQVARAWHAIYLSMDHYKQGKAPLAPKFDGGSSASSELSG